MNIHEYTQRSEALMQSLDQLRKELYEELDQLDRKRGRRCAKLPRKYYTGYNQVLLCLDRAKDQLLMGLIKAEDQPLSFPEQ